MNSKEKLKKILGQIENEFEIDLGIDEELISDIKMELSTSFNPYIIDNIRYAPSGLNSDIRDYKAVFKHKNDKLEFYMLDSWEKQHTPTFTAELEF